jgi:predicted nuclease of predicted toxin-antitoxin system
MNFVADESVDHPIVLRLREAGYTVWAVVEMEPGISDTVVLDMANQQKAILITGDKDFGDLVFRDKRYSFGIVLLRLAGLSAIEKANLVTSVITQRHDELPHAITVIGTQTVRIRRQLI